MRMDSCHETPYGSSNVCFRCNIFYLLIRLAKMPITLCVCVCAIEVAVGHSTVYIVTKYLHNGVLNIFKILVSVKALHGFVAKTKRNHSALRIDVDQH